MRSLLPIRIVLLFTIGKIVFMKHLLIEINRNGGETVDSYRQLPFGAPMPQLCVDQALQNVQSRHAMEAGGWITSGAPDPRTPGQFKTYSAPSGVHIGCGSNSFWGYAHSRPVGFVQATFRGSGSGILGFGNCVKSSVVNVYQNGQLIGSAGPNQNFHVKFMYKGGDILRITEENFGIIKINSLQLSCQAQPLVVPIPPIKPQIVPIPPIKPPNPSVQMVSIPLEYFTRLTKDRRCIDSEDYYSLQ